MITNKWFRGIDDLSLVGSLRKEIFNVGLNNSDLFSWHVVIYLQDKPVGFMTLAPMNYGEWKIAYLGVCKEYQGQKIGDLLMRLVVLKAEQITMEKIYSDIHPFFEKYGFKKYNDEMLTTNRIILPVYCKHKEGV